MKYNNKKMAMILLLVLPFFASFNAFSQSESESKTSSTALESMKPEIVDLSTELRLLEEKLLYPDAEQISIYLSFNTQEQFIIDNLKIKLDGEVIAAGQYESRQVNALNKGGIQRVFLGNITPGDHTLVAFFTGVDGYNKPYKRAASLDFNKGSTAKAIELKVSYSTQSLQPIFEVVER
ncbi:AraC family transcriptional regulator [Thalassotalea mangrovi]|uniref:AraC family transcriptional regulator n=1 Tax=Thalassotalea mangrovi TaxID=2572245 RepID=A0A4U1B6G2_9GAMM|nr:AraC family transcriptional regulator [Thalassotalea mangrovi]TKB46095.1 AraC family transcriptional regulator [Thalassotalea mangrovi]